MPSVFALRALLGAGLGFGALDLVWINAALAPRLVEPAPASIVARTEPAVTPTVTPIDVPAPAPEPTKTLVDHVYFETGSTTITPRSRKVLTALVDLAGPTATIALEGHADYRGTEANNETLSKDRAVSVQHELERLGVDSARIRVGYAGETQASSELWRDRRVDIQVDSRSFGGTR
jgi:outer membrane protein OmpA-like peptidoglycan-associated protein